MPPLILKLAARINEYVFPDVDVASEVRVERREEGEGVINRLLCESSKKAADFLRGVVGIVQLTLDNASQIALFTHERDHLLSLQWRSL